MRFFTKLDNHEPTRDTEYGELRPHNDYGMDFLTMTLTSDRIVSPEKAAYILTRNDGTLTPYYVAGWTPEQDKYWLQRMTDGVSLWSGPKKVYFLNEIRES